MAGKVTRDHHSLRRNLKLNGKYVSNDGGDEGLSVSDAGAVSTSGALTVGGDLTVSGTTTTLNTQTIEVEDNILQLNTTQASPDTATAATSGISVYRGNGVTQASLIFDEADDTWDLTNNIAVAGNIDLEGDIDVNGTANLDAVDIDGAVQIDNTVTVGVNDTGYDVKFFGATATNGYMLWDESTDDLILGSSSQLGIGTTSPSYELDVVSSGQADIRASGATQARLILNDSGGTSGARNWDLKVSDDVFQIRNISDDMGSVENTPFTANTSGNVGIGTATPISTLNLSVSDSGGNYAYFQNSTTGATTGDGFIVGINADESATLWQLENDHMSFGTNDTERMRITSGGNVCIGGTTDEGYNTLLNLEGAGGTDDVPGILFKNTSASNDEDIMALIASQGTDSVGAINIKREGNADDAYIDFLTQANSGSMAERMRITSVGSVGIGENAPGDNKLRVKQDLNSVALYIDNNGTDSGIELNNTGSTGRGFYAYTNQGSSANNALIHAYVDHVDYDQNVLLLQNDGASQALNIDQNGNANSIRIDSEATTSTVVHIDTPTSTSGNVLLIESANSLTSGAAIRVSASGSALATTAGGGLVEIDFDGDAGATANNLLFIKNDHSNSTGTKCLFIQQDANQEAFKIAHSGTTNRAMQIDASSLTTGDGLMVYCNASNTDSRKLVNIVNDNASATGATALYIQQDSIAPALVAMGNVGIGTASPATESSGTLLHIADTGGSNAAQLNFSGGDGASGSQTGKISFSDPGDVDDEVAFITGRIKGSNASPGGEIAFYSGIDGGAMVQNLILDSNSRISLSNNDNNTSNTVFGKSAFNAGSDNGSDYNAVFGESAMGNGSVSGANENAAFGRNAFRDATSGDNNVFVGSATGIQSTTIIGATAVGRDALGGVTTTGANYTTAIGFAALQALTDGAQNTAVGYQALSTQVSGDYNTAVGYQALKDANENTSNRNAAFGSGAMATLTTGIKNVAIGDGSMGAGVTTGDKNTSVGQGSGYQLTSGASNTLIGQDAGVALTEGNFNVLIGYQAGDALTTMTHNTAIGTDALSGSSLVDSCVIIGSQAGAGALTAAADGTVAIGYNAGNSITSGDGNVFIGYDSGKLVTTGSYNTTLGYGTGDAFATNTNHNTAIGYMALSASNTSGDSINVAVGSGALTALTSGTANVAVGSNAMYAADGGEDDNIAVGRNALRYLNHDASAKNIAIGTNAGSGITTADGNSHNIFMGYNSGSGSSWATDANSQGNVCVGNYTMTGTQDGANHNICLGYSSGNDITTGDYNTLIGQDAGALITSGTSNIVLGATALDAATTQSLCIAIGYNALTSLNHNDASGTVAIGYLAGEDITSGQYNTAVGYQALKDTVDGNANTALGYNALLVNTTGSNNTALGYATLGGSQNVGDANTAVGSNALTNFNPASDDVGHNTGLGYESGASLTTGVENTYVGSGAGYRNQTGDNNTYVGYAAGKGNAGDNHSNNTAVGKSALTAVTDGALNTIIGSNAATAMTTGHENVILGYSAGDATQNTGYSVIIGSDACGANMTNATDGTIAIGKGAMAALTTGGENMAIGYLAMDAMVAGNNNLALGHHALGDLNNSSAARNIAIGSYSGDGMGALANIDNIFIGYAAGGGTWSNAASSHNIAIGSYAMDAAQDGNGAQQNTVVGHSAGTAITTGDSNVFMGYLAGDSITTGYQNVLIGAGSDCNIVGGVNQIAIGYGTAGQGNNSAVFGNSSVSASHVQVDWTVDSDRRIKKDIEDSDIGLSFINALQTRKFRKKHPSEWDSEILDERYKKGGVNYDDEKDEIIKDEFDDEKVWNGLIAQEVKSAMDSTGESFSGWSENYKGKQGVQYSTMVIPLIKAVQELSAKVEELEAKLK